jgi:hypothetical protein
MLSIRLKPGVSAFNSELRVIACKHLDGRVEAIAASWVILDPLPFFSERFSQKRDALRKRALPDERIGPELLHQFVLAHNVTAVGNENQQRVKYLRWERYNFAIAIQEPVGSIQAEGSKLVHISALASHTPSEILHQSTIFRLAKAER